MTGLAGPAARVSTDLEALLGHVADAFALGDVGPWSVLTTGYEDCNIDLAAAAARVVVKVFAPDRGSGIAARTAAISSPPPKPSASATPACTATPAAPWCTPTADTTCW